MANHHPFFLIMLLLLLPLGSNAGSSVFNQRIASAYNQTIKLKIGTGRSLLHQELQESPSNAAALLIANYQDFLTLVVQQNPAHYSKIIAAQEKRLEILSSTSEKSPWVDYGLAEMRLHLALSKLIFDNKVAAAWDFRKAFVQFESNAVKHPSFLPNKKSLGMLQVLIGSVPENYKWALSIIGLKGSVKKGLQNLHLASTHENPFQDEAILLKIFLEQLIDQKYETGMQLTVQELLNKNPDNLLYTFMAMHLFKKTNKSEQALEFFLKRPAGKDYISFPYLHHMAADLYLAKGDFKQSVHQNKLFLSQHLGANHHKAAHFKLYLGYWLDNNKQQAVLHYHKIPETGKALVEEDIYAARFVQEKTSIHRELLLARLRSDGGYYREALKDLQGYTLSQATLSNVKIEYMYRKARIYHGLEDIAQAKKFYEYTISNAGSSTLYFAPNAALQLGYIYQEENNPAKARSYFLAVLNYKDHAYKNSIDSKAKLALSSL